MICLRLQQNEEGFTLVEMVVMLAIMALALTAADSLFRQRTTAFDLKRATREIAAMLKMARSRAILMNHETIFTLDMNERTASSEGMRDRLQLSECLGASLTTAKQEIMSSGTASFRFFPDGSSTGGRLTLTCEAQSAILEIDWMTGAVTVTP